MWHWLIDHWIVLSDIGLAWIAPVLVVFMAGRLLRIEYRGRQAGITVAAVRMDEDGAEKKKNLRSAA